MEQRAKRKEKKTEDKNTTEKDNHENAKGGKHEKEQGAEQETE